MLIHISKVDKNNGTLASFNFVLQVHVSGIRNTPVTQSSKIVCKTKTHYTTGVLY